MTFKTDSKRSWRLEPLSERTKRFAWQLYPSTISTFERSVIRQRVRTVLKRAAESGKQLGRAKIDPLRASTLRTGSY